MSHVLNEQFQQVEILFLTIAIVNVYQIPNEIIWIHNE